MKFRFLVQKLFFIFIPFFILSCATSNKSLNDSLAAQYFDIAQNWAQLSKYDKAIVYYKKAGENPNFNNSADWGLARMYAFTSKWQDAQNILQRMHTEDPTNELILSAYAYVYAKNGEIDKAITLYETLYNKNKENPDYAKNYAEILFAGKHFSECLALIQEIITQFPDDVVVSGLKKLETQIKEQIAKDSEPLKDGTPPVEKL